MKQDPSLSVIVLTHNEETHLPGCLQSAKLLDSEILVLDSGSTDHTIEIATGYGAQVHRRCFTGYADQRNAALELASSAWVLFLDADERITEKLASEITRAIDFAVASDVAYAIPRKNLAFGRALQGGGWWPDYQIRLLRPERCCYRIDRQVHETVELHGDIMYINEPMIHLNYRSRAEFVAKQHRYTNIARTDVARMHDPVRRRRILGAPAREFWRRYVRLEGYRDGLDGLFMASILALEALRLVWHQRRSAS